MPADLARPVWQALIERLFGCVGAVPIVLRIVPSVKGPRMSPSDPGHNHLSEETSPYLLQHKDNPVHWWAWGADALAEAKRTGRPILLSVGYAACHWCHVMAHESFEDDTTAAVMNELFVNIKVDREERPDVDAIYMGALHRLGERGGWPLTMFLDADARPFWGGTYFPKEARFGKAPFIHVLREVHRIYREEPEKISNNAAALTHMLQEQQATLGPPERGDAMLRDLTSRMVSAIDPIRGGLKGAPKFPQWSFFSLLWRGAIRYADGDAKHAVINTLANICQGGIYDHLGGGFARYSVDDRWLVPHFEKMLYDNALLLDLLTEAWRETQLALFKQRIEQTVEWLQREMIAEGGAFAASLDADSEGEEGKFYIWSKDEVMAALGPECGRRFCAVYDITDEGNFEGRNIPNRLLNMEFGAAGDEAQLAQMRAGLFQVRAPRVRPGWDDKVLADWNGLMIASLSRAAQVFNRSDWHVLVRQAFAFVEQRMMTVDGRLIHSFRAGKARAPATASDYANMIWAAVRLHEATGDPYYITRAETWVAILDRHYWSTSHGGYHITADDTPNIIVRLRNAHDDAVPNANAIMISNLVALWMLTGKPSYLERAEEIPTAFSADLARSRIGHCGLLAAFYDLNAPALVAILTDDADASADVGTRGFLGKEAGRDFAEAAHVNREAAAAILPPSQSLLQGADAPANRRTSAVSSPNQGQAAKHQQAGDDTGERDRPHGPMRQALYSLSVPGALELAAANTTRMPAASPLAGKTVIAGLPTAYICVGPQCSLPQTEAGGFRVALEASRSREC